MTRPGIFVQELSAPPSGIVGVSTSTGAMLMEAERGDIANAVLVTNFQDFLTKYGSALSGKYGAYAAKSFFDNGGKNLYVVRVVSSVTPPTLATVTLNDRSSGVAASKVIQDLTYTADSVGTGGNAITIEYTTGGTAGAEVVTVLGNAISVQIDSTNSTATQVKAAVDAFPAAAALVDVTISGTPGTGQTAPVAPTNLLGGVNAGIPTLQVNAISQGTWGNGATGGLQVTIANGTLDSVNRFNLTVLLNGQAVEQFTELSMVSSDGNYAPGLVNGVSNYVTLTDLFSVTAAPNNRPTTQVATSLAGATDGATVIDSDFTNSFNKLTAVEANMNVCSPGVPGTAEAVNLAGINYCSSRGDCTYFAELAANTTIGGSQTERALMGDKSYGALYYPWILVSDYFGTGSNPVKYIPPAGAVLGVCARVDADRGVHKSPAGVDSTLADAIGVQTKVTDTDQDALNAVGINCIRVFNNLGVVVWGARTLSYQKKLIFLQTRRFLNFVKSSFKQNFQFAVFEPNDNILWAQLIRMGNMFLTEQWKNRALFGKSADDAFFIKCDETNNPPAQIDAGILHYRVGVRPTRPAEQIILEFTQFDGKASVTEL
jgi:uncharacterized protein